MSESSELSYHLTRQKAEGSLCSAACQLCDLVKVLLPVWASGTGTGPVCPSRVWLSHPFLGARFPLGRKEQHSVAFPKTRDAQVTLGGRTRPARTHQEGVPIHPVGGGSRPQDHGMFWGSRETVLSEGRDQVGTRGPFGHMLASNKRQSSSQCHQGRSPSGTSWPLLSRRE